MSHVKQLIEQELTNAEGLSVGEWIIKNHDAIARIRAAEKRLNELAKTRDVIYGYEIRAILDAPDDVKVTVTEPECKYCDGGVEDLIFHRLEPLKDLGSDLCIDASVYITDDGELKLFSDLNGDTEIIKKTIKINYCPMCGRRLDHGSN